MKKIHFSCTSKSSFVIKLSNENEIEHFLVKLANLGSNLNLFAVTTVYTLKFTLKETKTASHVQLDNCLSPSVAIITKLSFLFSN